MPQTASEQPPAAPDPSDLTHTSEPAHGAAVPATSGWVPASQHRARDRYRFLGEHGRGGLGRVSRVHDLDLGRDIAIKELISRGAINEMRFLREALITARLEHPGIVPVHEAGRWPDGTPFYAMKLVAGRPLRELIVERKTVEERLRLLHHVIAVADAIAYAHGRNVIHRDLKPANIIVGEFGETIVIDWGLAKDLSAPEVSSGSVGSSPVVGDEGLTSMGSVLGTPAYMSPEQARGEPVDQRTDVFAIGVMLWELCTLQKLPSNYSREGGRILRMSRIDRDLATIIAKAIEPEPVRRYPHAGALAADLKSFKSGARIAARRYSMFAMLGHWMRRHRLHTVGIITVLALAVIGVVFYVRSTIAEQIAEQIAIQAEVEQGRQALLHGEFVEAQVHLGQAYRRGDRSPAIKFMLARALQPRIAELARLASSAGRVWWSAFSPDGRRIGTADDNAVHIWDAESYKLLFTLHTARSYTTPSIARTGCGSQPLAKTA